MLAAPTREGHFYCSIVRFDHPLTVLQTKSGRSVNRSPALKFTKYAAVPPQLFDSGCFLFMGSSDTGIPNASLTSAKFASRTVCFLVRRTLELEHLFSAFVIPALISAGITRSPASAFGSTTGQSKSSSSLTYSPA